ncbi:thioredoxin-related transmembrane protein 1-like [Atheta coriaria]|uniref:thioredoxin-related transmembrane protein 1-like n=1 Tax=Dalotia coriaria TaxID=877792 RepID=UPI0031F38CA9
MACGRATLSALLLITCAFVCVRAGKQVVDLNEDNWRLMLQNEWMVEFYAPWCPACKGLESIWRDFATWSDDIGISVAKVDVTTSPGLSGRFMVTALPTIFHVLNGEFRQYKGSRDKDAFISFVEEKKWKSVEPVPSWQSPNSVQMGIVSTFFKLSQVLRQVHNMLMEEYGLPSWGSYLIFSIATIFIGAILGLILVCVIDLIYPQKYPAKVDLKKSAGGEAHKDKDSDVELSDEDIKDDLVDDASQSEGDGEVKSSSDDNAAAEKSSPGVKKRKSRKE